MRRRRCQGPGLQELIDTAVPGTCPFCGEPALPKAKSDDAVRRRTERGGGEYFLTCGDYLCHVTAYQRAYKRDLRRGLHRRGPRK